MGYERGKTMDKNQAKATAGELKKAADYFQGNIAGDKINFGFAIDGAGLFSGAAHSETAETDRANISKSWETGGLLVTQEAILYRDLPVVEWVVWIENRSESDSGVVSFDALDDLFEIKNAVVRHQKGSYCAADDFCPKSQKIAPGSGFSEAPIGGRSSNMAWPYFCVEGDSGGINIAVGWPMQWEMKIGREGDFLRVKCGQQKLESVVRPGEKFRSPRIVLQFWEKGGLSPEDSVTRSKNIFRSYMRGHNMPRDKKGSIPGPNLAACSSHQFIEMHNANTKNQIEFIDGYADNGMKLDYWWMDAGWFPLKHNSWYPSVGTWECDKSRFPNGLREISDHGRSRGFGTIIWFEVERAHRGSYLYENKKEWLFSPEKNDNALFNFGDAEAAKWMTDKINSLIDEFGIDLYRQDFNIDPFELMAPYEKEGRLGANENLYSSGLLAYWDSLQSAHPGMLIDTCASGGRRNDIDTLRRCVPLLRSDQLFIPEEQQAHFMGISGFVPFSGTGILIGASVLSGFGEDWCRDQNGKIDAYAIRSCYSPSNTWCLDVRDPKNDWEDINRHLAQWRKIAPYYISGDLYPLTEHSLGLDAWAAWQFGDPDGGAGAVQAFRRPDSEEGEKRFRLCGLEAESIYSVFDFDTEETRQSSGAALMEEGLEIALPKRGSCIITYCKQ